MKKNTIDKGGYILHTINKKGFKNNIIKIIFKDKYDKDSVTANNLLIDCLTYSTKNYPSRRDLLRRYEYLYDMDIRSRVSRTGKIVFTELMLEFLDPKYCEPNYLEEVIGMLFEIINNPKIDKNGFDKENFDISKSAYLSYLETLSESSGKYAYRRALYNMDKDSISTYSMDGDIEELKKIKRKDLINNYNHLINDTECHIFVCGDLDMKKVEQIIDDNYKKNKKNIIKDDYYVDNKKRDKVLDVEESGPYKQDILYMIFNIDKLNKYEEEVLLPVYSYILSDGGLTSKLYKRVREDNALCYSISSFYDRYDGLFFTCSGISRDNKELCVKLINECYKEMADGKFTKKELEEAKRYLVHSLDNADNSIGRIINGKIGEELIHIYSVKEKQKLYKNVTKEELINISNKIHINTIYMLRGEA